MGLIEVTINNRAADVMGKRGHDKARKAHINALRKGIAHMERHHKRKEWLPGGGKKAFRNPHPTMLRVRTGRLWKSYGSLVLERALEARYGSDESYSRIHEFGGMAGRNHASRIPARPGIKRTIDATANAIERIFDKALDKEGL